MYYCPGLIHLLSVLHGDALRRHLQTKHERYNYIVKYGQRKKAGKIPQGIRLQGIRRE
jgi:hypothetical protein